MLTIKVKLMPLKDGYKRKRTKQIYEVRIIIASDTKRYTECRQVLVSGYITVRIPIVIYYFRYFLCL